MKLLPWVVSLALLTTSAACKSKRDNDDEVLTEEIELSALSLGEDLTLRAGVAHTLSASIEYAGEQVDLAELPDDLALTFAWEGSEGLAFDGQDGPLSVVIADAAGEYTATLTVSADGLSTPLTASIDLTVIKLEVSAGEDESGLVDEVLSLSGEVVTSAADYTLVWSGSGLQFSKPHALMTTVTAAAPGTYRAWLTVQVGELEVSDNVAITVAEVGGPPVVNAGEDQSGTVNQPLQLSPAVATDDELAEVSWTGEGLTFGSDSSLATTAVASAPGTYVATLRVTTVDGQEGSDSIALTFVAEEEEDEEPDTGPDPVTLALDITGPLSAEVGSPLTLTGELTGASTEATWLWSGTGVTFSASDAAETEVTSENPGAYTVTLMATDGDRNVSASVTVTFTARPEPTIDLGEALTVEVNTALSLAASVDIPDGYQDVTLLWQQVSGPGTALFDDSAVAETGVQFDRSGEYVLSLTVSADGVEVSAELQVLVQDPITGALNLALLTLDTSLVALDAPLVQFLRSRGHQVLLYPPSATVAEVEMASPDAVLISSSMDSSALSTDWASSALPMIVWEFYALNRLGMSEPIAADSAHDWTGGPYIDIEAEAVGHPSLAGLSGRVKVSNGDSILTAAPVGEAVILARLVGDPPPVGDVVAFAYEQGSMMAEELAPARRLGLPLGLDLGEALTADGRDLVEAALAWVTKTRFERRTRVLPLGDEITRGASTTGGYRAPLAALLDDAGCGYDFVGTLYGGDGAPSPSTLLDWDHQGIAAYRTTDLPGELPQLLEGNRPDVVLLHMGTHDLRDGEDAMALRAGLQTVVENLRSISPSITVVLSQLIPYYDDPMTTSVEEANAAIVSLATELNQSGSPAVFVDPYTDFDLGTMSEDGMLPNVAGATHMAEAFFPALTPFLTCE